MERAASEGRFSQECATFSCLCAIRISNNGLGGMQGDLLVRVVWWGVSGDVCSFRKSLKTIQVFRVALVFPCEKSSSSVNEGRKRSVENVPRKKVRKIHRSRGRN